MGLPLVRSSFTGRDAELRELERLAADAAVVTLVGTGGVGKTRLALEFAHSAGEAFPGGIWLVDLSATTAPELVVPEVAAALGVATGSSDPVPLVVEQVGDRESLLLVDNCEHLVDAAAAIVHQLASACPNLRVLATSREPLGLAAEVCLPVAPLEIARDAVRLFTDRAWTAGARAPLDGDDVAALCARLDGIPLAIELAASWVRVLSPRELLARLDNRFDVLAAARRDLPPRQRTMHATVEWSHRLLTDHERVLFRRLAVFQGTFGLDAAEAICGWAPLAPGRVAGLLGDLVGRSMVVAERGPADTGGRCHLLETLRDFAAEQLAAAGEQDELSRRHFAHWLSAAEKIDGVRLRTGSDSAVTTLTPDGDNLRVALRWSIERDPPGALRLAAALEGFWMMRSVGEGGRWLRRALDAAPEPTWHRARALMVSPLVVASGVPWPEARGLLDESVALFTSLGDEAGAAMARVMAALSAFFNGEIAEAERRVEDALARHAGLGHPLFHARAATYLGAALSFAPRRLEAGRHRLAEGAERSRGIGDGWGEGLALMLLGLADLRAGRPESAREHLRAALRLNLQGGVTASAIGGLGQLALERDPRRACTLLEAAYAVLERAGVPRFAVEIGRRLATARQRADRRLARPVAERCRARARAMTTEEVIALALEEPPLPDPAEGRLTARQLEVALLVASGLTNREIAQQLHLSVRTVESHVDDALRELGFHSRSRLAAWVRERELVTAPP
ncbi:MAG TPA: LuxR C-terminal-related transcriptional regulator [Terriglobales bacterium]|nr:LuxR C-terminal-related transcriptional regulator [Terriglobales bacterium]